ncbi:MAG: hypothetical protein VB081_05180 [Christensenella sp.]|nr:hypothetical protein [Christensenella sp.]MEA5002871.1 hypothetical protein [Christensenella sp.]
MKQFVFWGILAAALLGIGIYTLAVRIKEAFQRKKTERLSSGYYID